MHISWYSINDPSLIYKWNPISFVIPIHYQIINLSLWLNIYHWISSVFLFLQNHETSASKYTFLLNLLSFFKLINFYKTYAGTFHWIQINDPSLIYTWNPDFINYNIMKIQLVNFLFIKILKPFKLISIKLFKTSWKFSG